MSAHLSGGHILWGFVPLASCLANSPMPSNRLSLYIFFGFLSRFEQDCQANASKNKFWCSHPGGSQMDCWPVRNGIISKTHLHRLVIKTAICGHEHTVCLWSSCF